MKLPLNLIVLKYSNVYCIHLLSRKPTTVHYHQDTCYLMKPHTVHSAVRIWHHKCMLKACNFYPRRKRKRSFSTRTTFKEKRLKDAHEEKHLSIKFNYDLSSIMYKGRYRNSRPGRSPENLPPNWETHSGDLIS